MARDDPDFISNAQKVIRTQVEVLLKTPSNFSFKPIMSDVQRIYKVNDPETFFFGYTLGHLMGLADGISIQSRGRLINEQEGLVLKELIEEYAARVKKLISELNKQ